MLKMSRIYLSVKIIAEKVKIVESVKTGTRRKKSQAKTFPTRQIRNAMM